MLNTDLYHSNQSVTLPTGFATVLIENIKDFFLNIVDKNGGNGAVVSFSG